MMVAGPISGAALGAAALYAATKEGSTGTITRKVGSTFLQVTDRAVDVGLQAADVGAKKVGVAVEKGCQKLQKDVDLSTMPAPVRIGVTAVLNSQTKQTRSPSVISEEANQIRKEYPDRVPVICERSPYSTGIPEMNKKKFIVPGSMLCGEFKYMIHRNLSQALTGHRGAEQTIYIFVNGLAPKTSTPLSDLYEKFRADDGFLYIKYGAENTLG
jgi:GABA(A) receptor-associated protein